MRAAAVGGGPGQGPALANIYGARRSRRADLLLVSRGYIYTSVDVIEGSCLEGYESMVTAANSVPGSEIMVIREI